MDDESAARIFSALGHPTRLRAVRAIGEGRADGVTPGELARALELPASLLSSHLAVLLRAGAVTAEWRSGRKLYEVAPGVIRIVVGGANEAP